jgi:hypothetical protein
VSAQASCRTLSDAASPAAVPPGSMPKSVLQSYMQAYVASAITQGLRLAPSGIHFQIANIDSTCSTKVRSPTRLFRDTCAAAEPLPPTGTCLKALACCSLLARAAACCPSLRVSPPALHCRAADSCLFGSRLHLNLRRRCQPGITGSAAIRSVLPDTASTCAAQFTLHLRACLV